MKSYETMMITSAKLDEEATAAVVGKFKSLIEANGTIDAVDEWGKRRLAYPIEKEEEGVYTLIYFTSGPDFPAELDRVYGITDGVLRYLTLARPEGAELPNLEPKAEAKAEEPAAEKAEEPKAEEKAEEPKADEPKAEEPKAEEPAAEEAKAEEKAEEPAAEEPKAEEPVAEEKAEEKAEQEAE